MRAIDILTMAESICKILADNSVSPTDVHYIALYKDWKRMKTEGHKYSYIVYYLSMQYGISESSINRIVMRMDKELSI